MIFTKQSHIHSSLPEFTGLSELTAADPIIINFICHLLDIDKIINRNILKLFNIYFPNFAIDSMSIKIDSMSHRSKIFP